MDAKLSEQQARISIHAPAQGATRKAMEAAKEPEFQSTPPRRGRRLLVSFRPRFRCISIHAPAQGATVPLPALPAPRPYFNPRPRAGGDRLRLFLRALLRISIHAPAQGATYGLEIIYEEKGISIHAPAQGATLIDSLRFRRQFHFNPRPRAGGDQWTRGGAIAGGTFQSTPPRRGRQQNQPTFSRTPYYFYTNYTFPLYFSFRHHSNSCKNKLQHWCEYGCVFMSAYTSHIIPSARRPADRRDVRLYAALLSGSGCLANKIADCPFSDQSGLSVPLAADEAVPHPAPALKYGILHALSMCYTLFSDLTQTALARCIRCADIIGNEHQHTVPPLFPQERRIFL